MGEYANCALQSYIRNGMRFNPNFTPRKRPRVSCLTCRREFAGIEGVMEHQKAKHGKGKRN